MQLFSEHIKLSILILFKCNIMNRKLAPVKRFAFLKLPKSHTKNERKDGEKEAAFRVECNQTAEVALYWAVSL